MTSLVKIMTYYDKGIKRGEQRKAEIWAGISPKPGNRARNEQPGKVRIVLIRTGSTLREKLGERHLSAGFPRCGETLRGSMMGLEDPLLRLIQGDDPGGEGKIPCALYGKCPLLHLAEIGLCRFQACEK